MAKILIVEDDKGTNEAICEYLKPTGHEIVSAYDGDEAVTGNRQLCLSHLFTTVLLFRYSITRFSVTTLFGKISVASAGISSTI